METRTIDDAAQSVPETVDSTIVEPEDGALFEVTNGSGTHREAPAATVHQETGHPPSCGALDKVSRTLARDNAEMIERLASLALTLGEIAANRRALDSLHEENRRLREGSHEREVLLPVYRLLMGLADRMAVERNALREKYASLGQLDNGLAACVVQQVLNAREADATEVVNTLAHLGIEPFVSRGNTFDRELHHCVERVVTSKEKCVDKIARRLRNGYRRGPRILRKEYVSVFVHE